MKKIKKFKDDLSKRDSKRRNQSSKGEKKKALSPLDNQKYKNFKRYLEEE